MKKLLIIAALGALALAACKEEVKQREVVVADSITLDYDNLEITIGETVQLNATVLPENNEKPLRWLSTKPEVASVSEEGEVEGKAPGEAVIIAVSGEANAICHVFVIRAIEELTLSDESISIHLKETFALQAQIVPGNATEIIQWSSDHPEIASVDEDGVVTGVADGQAVITAKTLKTSAQCAVEVFSVHATGISLSGPAEVGKGREETLTAALTPSDATDEIVWVSSAPEIASVNNGVVKGLALGEATITASVGELSAIHSISVVPVQVEEIVINPAPIALTEIGQSVQVTATVLPEDATDKSFTWSIDNPAVASIDENGNVTALAGGSTTIRATAPNGVEGSAKVNVISAIAVPYLEDFEDKEFVESNWTFIDADGDGFNWNYHSNEGQSTGLHEAHSGYGIVISASYDNDTNSPLTPDNWLISPPIILNGTSNYLSFWVCGQDASYALEHYAAYVTTDTNFSEANWTKILEGTVTQGYSMASVNKPLDASTYENIISQVPAEFNGQTVYFAIRHFDVTDQFIINVDDFAVTENDPTEASDPTPQPTYYRAPARDLPGLNARKIVR